MEQMTVKEILEATGGRLLRGSLQTPVKNLAIDSGKTEPGDLFIPFRGERTDGHLFLTAAFANGAAACMTEMPHVQAPEDKPLILAADSRKALQDIGAYYRKRLSLSIVGVTGSVGKTSVRELTGQALAEKLRVCATRGNYNGQLGVPITLARIGMKEQAAVLEMGVSLPGEMEIISRIARVSVAIVTNIGVSHIENLGSRDGICQEKLHITDGMEEDGLLILNGDDDMLRKYGSGQPFRKIWYGTDISCDYRAENIHAGEKCPAYTLVWNQERIPVRLNMPGVHNVKNSLAAIAAAHELGIPLEDAAAAAERFCGFSRRLEIQEINGIWLIDDSYNACPDSMKAALQVLDSMDCAGKKIAVLADMWELGPDSPLFHYQTGNFGGTLDIDEYLFIGRRAREIGRGVEETGSRAAVRYFMDNALAAAALEKLLRPGDMVLLKGSNGMHLNEIAEKLRKVFAHFPGKTNE